MIKLFGLLILLGVFSSLCGKTGNSAARFGEKVKFSQNEPVKFSDLTLIYIGVRRIISDLPRQEKSVLPWKEKPYFREFVYFDFKAQSEGEEQTVSWSSGTGDIAPILFVIGGKKYELELAISDRLGKLAENELVVWKK